MPDMAILSLKIFKLFFLRGHAPQNPLEASAFGTQLLSHLLLHPSHVI